MEVKGKGEVKVEVKGEVKGKVEGKREVKGEVCVELTAMSVCDWKVVNIHAASSSSPHPPTHSELHQCSLMFHELD